MYNSHRGMVPPAPSSRLAELIDQIRQEFESQAGRTGEYEHQLTNQMHEMELVRQKVYQLEQAQLELKKTYDAEIARLHRELETRGGPAPPAHGGASAHGAGQPPPPSIGHGPSNIFGGIMAGQGGQGGPGLAPPQDQSQAPPQAGPPHQMPQPPPAVPQPGPLQAPPQPYAAYGGAPPPVNGYAAPPPNPAASPGPGKGRNIRGLPGPNTPQQPAGQYPDPRASPQVARPTPPPPQPPPQHPVANVGNFLADLRPERLGSYQKKEGSDWYAVFNPQVQRALDVDLVHTLQHDSVVCCVRFSLDGKYVATGCNRAAQIFDVATGARVSYLEDASVEKDGDLYIRSVCFSPDGRYLATGAEDKLIRVWDIASRSIKHTFAGHEQDIYSLDYSRTGRHIASGSGDRTVRLWDVDAGQNVLTFSIEDGVTTVAISPDGRYVAAGSLDKSVRVWDASTGLVVERLDGADGHRDSVYSVSFAPNGRDIVSGSLDKSIKLWELPPRAGLTSLSGTGPKGGKCIRTFEGHKDFVLSVALTPDNLWILSGSKDRGVQFWDPRTGNAQLMLQGHKNSVISVAPSPSGNVFATGSGDMRARIWSYEPYRGP
ncbi:MAG: general transcription repressor [Phylliscum demangeonii]|nr:MAG: general transcription repressor [Phylliscum demangeonii]